MTLTQYLIEQHRACSCVMVIAAPGVIDAIVPMTAEFRECMNDLWTKRYYAQQQRAAEKAQQAGVRRYKASMLARKYMVKQ